jgi:hypothetical protein
MNFQISNQTNYCVTESIAQTILDVYSYAESIVGSSQA